MRWTASSILMLSLAPLAVGAAGCKSDPPVPIRVAEQDPIIEPRVRPERTGPFRNPNVDAPSPRQGKQLDAEELAATRKQARDQFASGKADLAISTLQRCANKIPQSIECEGELALLLLRTKKQKAVADYYLDEASIARPATAQTSQYRRMGTVALEHARYEAATAALQVVVDRDEATVDDYINYGRTLRRDRARLSEATEAYAKAHALDPKRHALLDDQAKLLERQGDHSGAADMLRRYIAATTHEGRDAKILEQRLAELERLATGSAKSAAK